MQRGEVRWYRFKKPDKKRPVLILTRSSALEYLGEVTVAPITTTIRGIPTEVLLSKDEGLPKDCAINLDHVQTVAKDKLGGVISKLAAEKMSSVREALLFALEF